MDNAKNFKTKNIILRVVSFVLYFLTAGFTGNLCVVLIEPLFSLALGGYPGFKAMILYIISAAVMFAIISVFSKREGYNDTELLRFSVARNALSYIIAGGVLFCFAISAYFTPLAPFITPTADYFFAPYFLPAEIDGMIADIVFFSGIPGLYHISEIIKYMLAAKWLNLFFSVGLCVALSAVFYKTGRKQWIEMKKRKIETARLSGK